MGLLTPYYENNGKVTLCPSLNAPPGFYSYTSPNGQPLTGGYGYNKALGGRKMVTIPSTNTTYLFGDAALLRLRSLRDAGNRRHRRPRPASAEWRHSASSRP